MKRFLFLVPVVLASLAPGGCRPRPAAVPAAHTPAAPTVSIDTGEPALYEFDPGDVPDLRRHLASSAAWKLTEQGSRLVAFRREPLEESDGKDWRASRDGFAFRHQPWRRFRVMLGLGDGPSDQPEWQSVLSAANPDARAVDLKYVQATPPDYRSNLLLKGENNLVLEILEESGDTSRDTTRQFLRTTDEELNKVLEDMDELEGKGYLSQTAPKSSVSRGPASVKVTDTPDPGIYQVVGYANPGTPGAVYLKAFSGNTPLAPDDVRAQTLEYIGWSADAKTQFFFNSQLRIEGEAGAAPIPVRFEVWFHPEGAAADRKLLTTERKIRYWKAS